MHGYSGDDTTAEGAATEASAAKGSGPAATEASAAAAEAAKTSAAATEASAVEQQEATEPSAAATEAPEAKGDAPAATDAPDAQGDAPPATDVPMPDAHAAEGNTQAEECDSTAAEAGSTATEALEADARAKDAPRKYAVVDDIGDDWIRLKMIGDAAMEANGNYPFKKVAWKDFQESWEILYDATQVQDRGIIKDWAQYSIRENADHMAHVAKSTVSVGLDILAKSLPVPNVSVELRPKKKVVATAMYKVGDLRIVPNSVNLHVDKATEKKSDSFRYETKTKTEDGRAVWILPHPVNVPAPGASKKTGSVEPLWCIRKITDDAKEGEEPIGNMKIKHIRVLGALAVRILDEAAEEQASQGQESNMKLPLNCKVEEYSVTVPLLINTKDRVINLIVNSLIN